MAVTGGISAYKTPSIVSILVNKGHNVHVACTECALDFVTEMSLATMSKYPVLKNLKEMDGKIYHIDETEWCDLFVVVPATANMIGKIANGIADDLVSTMAMASTHKVKLLFPAMNTNMWNNYIMQENLSSFARKWYDDFCDDFFFCNSYLTDKWIYVEPEIGKLACGSEGIGKLPSTKRIIDIIDKVEIMIKNRNQPMENGKHYEKR